MRRTDMDPAIVGERRYAEHVQAQLQRLRVDTELVGDPERPSVIGEARVSGAAETILIASHLDTVPVDGMEIPPFDPDLRDGRLYGRGSCDTKAGMAALLDALQTVLERGTLRRNVIVVGESDEELGSVGVQDVLRALGPARRPDWVIANEPTSLRVVNAHKGVARARLHATGVAVHSSDPDAGRNAIVELSRAVLALEELRLELLSSPDPRLGPGTLSIGLMAGGAAANIVPEQAWLIVDRRTLPGEDEKTLRKEVESAIAAAGLEHVAVEWSHSEKPPLGTPEDHCSVRACQRAVGAGGLSTELDTAAFGTDAGVFAADGIPGVVFGPGSIEQAHTATEFVDVAQVETCADIFVRLLETPGD